MTPAVSVILAVYNGMPFLPAAVDSVLAQTFEDLECVAIDDGSTDGSGAWLDERARADARLRVIHQQNRGLAASLNRGIEEARAPLIARMDADDVSESERIARQVAYLDAHPEVVLLGTRAVVTDVEGGALWTAPLPLEDAPLRAALRGTSPFFHGSVMVRKAEVEAAGRYDDVRGVEDLFLFQRLARRGRLANIEAPLYRYRLSPAAASMLPTALERLRVEIAAAAWPEGVLTEADRVRINAAATAVSARRRRAQYHTRIGKGLLHYRGDRAGAARALLRAVLAAPGDPRTWMRLALPLLPRTLLGRRSGSVDEGEAGGGMVPSAG